MKYGIIKKNSIIPKLASVFISVYAITLYPFVFILDDGNERVITHERIHILQQKEMLVLFFYIAYALFFVLGLIKHRSINLAYRNIPFEKEAYDNDTNIAYVLNRKRFAWTKYI